MIAFSDDWVYAAVAAVCLGILLACIDNWFQNRQRKRRRAGRQ